MHLVKKLGRTGLGCHTKQVFWSSKMSHRKAELPKSRPACVLSISKNSSQASGAGVQNQGASTRKTVLLRAALSCSQEDQRAAVGLGRWLMIHSPLTRLQKEVLGMRSKDFFHSLPSSSPTCTHTLHTLGTTYQLLHHFHQWLKEHHRKMTYILRWHNRKDV